MTGSHWKSGRVLRSLDLDKYSDQILYVHIASETVFRQLPPKYLHVGGIGSLMDRMAEHEVNPANVRLIDGPDWRDGPPRGVPRKLRHELANNLQAIMRTSGLPPVEAYRVMAVALDHVSERGLRHEF